jgi:leucyl-tRNA synthetase
VDRFLPTEDGEPPLARAKDWSYDPQLGRVANGEGAYPLETTTMPGWAGSSWYFLRYMDPKNDGRFASAEAINYWQQVDLYVGGSEHATGHLLYFRFWTKFLKDRGWINFDEPAKKLVNQGMIQGRSAHAYRMFISPLENCNDEEEIGGVDRRNPVFVSKDLLDDWASDEKERVDRAWTIVEAGLIQYETQLKQKEPSVINVERDSSFPHHQLQKTLIPTEFLAANESEENILRTEKLLAWRDDFANAFFIEGKKGFVVAREVDKMSKSKWNVVNPDDIIERYGADTLRLYEMFLGPIEQSKPWDTNGIEGTSRFLKKFWNLFHSAVASPGLNPGHGVDPEAGNAFHVDDAEPTKAELKVLHATLKKVTEDIEKLSFNTSVSQFMIACNGLHGLKCHKRAVLEPLTIVLAPFAPHIAEELWQLLGHEESVTQAAWPKWDSAQLVEDSFSYPISFNGKTRLQLEFPIALDAKGVEAAVLANPEVQARLEGKAPKKVIVVPKRIVNIVL